MARGGCGLVGRAVAYNTRGPRFESSHWQKFVYCQLHIETTKIKKKRPGMAHLKQQLTDMSTAKPLTGKAQQVLGQLYKLFFLHSYIVP